MTYNKLFGVYFSENVASSTPTVERIYTPCFIVQTSSALSIDNTLTKFETLSAFKTLVEGKGLTQTAKYIEQIMNDYQSEIFYVYSIKTDTAAAFTAFVRGTANKEDIKDFIYIEETKSAEANSIASKMTAIAAGLRDNYEKGVFRTCTVIPYGTVHDAVTNMEENDSKTTVAITAMTTAMQTITSGRIIMVCPDDAYCGYAAGRVLSTDYNREPGYTALTIIDPLEYEFNYDEMLQLQNAGIVFVKDEVVQGVHQYRIHAGLTASFAQSAADGFIKARKTVDELLRRVKDVCSMYTKADDDIEQAKINLQTECTNIVDEFVANADISQTATIDNVKYTSALTVTVVDRYTINVTGTLIPSGSAMVINVNTNIQ